MSEERKVPTSQPRRVAVLLRELRLRAMRTLSSASTAPDPSLASTPATRSTHQVLPATFRVAPASRMARQPSGQDLSVELACCMSAVQPAAAGAAMLVPLLVRPTAVTDVPLAASSGSSRSLCAEAGLRNTEVADIADAVSSW